MTVCLRRGVPDGGRGEAVEGGVVGQGGRERPRPADPVLVDAISHKSRHRNAAVLHLSMAEEPDGGVVALVPKVLVAELERVEVAEHWVLRLREAAEVLRHDDGAGRRLSDSGESDSLVAAVATVTVWDWCVPRAERRARTRRQE